ncbi:MAG: adenylate/guanylate cyclase domain-containing protein [Acidimicrobiales bacterium]
MSELPDTRYTSTVDGVRIAYQVWGSGPRDLVVVRDASTPIDCLWDEPRIAHMLQRLGGFCRNIWFDARGWGSSDVLTLRGLPGMDAWLDDITAVMSAVSSEKAVVAGMNDGGSPTILFAATYPHRVSALVLVNTYARFVQAPDYPCGLPPELFDRYLEAMVESWGTLQNLKAGMAPSMVGDEHWCRWMFRSQRLGSSPTGVEAFMRAVSETNVHHVLPSIQVPTIVLHRRENRHVRVEHGRYLADHIPGALYKELPGEDHAFYAGDTDALVDEIEEFVTGVRPVRETDRVLATVLFTDIVGSSRRATELGDGAWRTLLDAHDAVVRSQLLRHRGREIKTTGDGFLAAFDGPARAIRCACAIRDSLRPLGLEVRCGLHTGEIEERGDDVTGIAVVIGQRVSSMAGAGEVMVSSTVKDLVAGSGLRFEGRGEHELKGVPGTWRLFAARDD